MVIWEQVSHQAAIAGTVRDVQMQQPIAGAWVALTSAPAEFTAWLALKAKQYGDTWATLVERPDRTRTSLDGHFHFVDLPNGQYTLTASLPGAGSRFATAQATVTVSRDSQGNLTLVAADLALPPTTIKGQVTGQNNSPVVLARVRVQGSGEESYSDGQGQFTLAGIETGNRTVLVSAQGYKPASQAIQVAQPGVVQALNVALVAATT